MGLSDVEKERRKNDEYVKYIAEHVCNKDGDKSYVFVSYKSDDWEIVLQDIVYRLVKEYGLNVYFDGDFDVHNRHWTTQFPKNMSDPKCKGVLIFLNDNYATSYATLLELMYSQCYCQNPKTLDFVKRKVVAVNLTKALSVIYSEDDTGLGKTSYSDGDKKVQNPKAMAEKELFDKAFQRGCKIGIFDKAEAAYKKEDLSKKLCSVMVSELLSSIDYNDKEYFQKGGSLDSIVSSIKSACGFEVFNKSKQSEDNNGDFKRIREEAEDKISEPNVSPMLDTVSALPSENLSVYSAKGESSLPNGESDSDEKVNVFKYQLWSVLHTAGKLSDMMHDVFDLVAEKYPEKIIEIAYNESISAVALKQDVDDGNLPKNKMDYFRTKKEHEVGGNIYYVSTRYNRENGIGQLEKILSFCEGSADAFKILSAPEKVAHSSKGKKGAQ